LFQGNRDRKSGGWRRRRDGAKSRCKWRRRKMPWGGDRGVVRYMDWGESG